MIMKSDVVIPHGPNTIRNYGFYMKGKGDGCHEGSMFRMGNIHDGCIIGIQNFGFV
jgi:hypothetical protein